MILRGSGSAQIKQVLIYDVSTRILPRAACAVGALLSRVFRKRAERVCDEMRRRTTPGPCPKAGVLVLERDYKNTSAETTDLFDAVMSLASDLPQARQVRRTARGVFTVDTKDPIEIAPAIMFAIMESSEKDGSLEKVVITVFSYTKDIVQLRDFLSDVEQDYLKNRGNHLGRQIY